MFIKDYINRIAQEKKQRDKVNQENRIKEKFAIEEIKGKIAITLFGTPIQVFDGEATTKTIEEAIQQFRQTAIKYQ